MTVLQVGADGLSVVVGETEDGERQVMQCAGSYPVRAQGDLVTCAQKSNGTWLVLCVERARQIEIPEPLTEERVIALITERIPVVVPGEEISMGVGAPSGPGWKQATTLPWTRERGVGGREIYIDTMTPDPPSTRPPNPPGATPSSVTIQPVSQGAWRSSEENPLPIAGSYGSSRGGWVGGYWYGDRIVNACAGKTVSTMNVLDLNRIESRHGVWQSVPIHLGLMSAETRPTISNHWDPGGRLELGGEEKRSPVPSTQRALLVSGDFRGIGVHSDGGGDFIKYGPGGGAVRITFA